MKRSKRDGFRGIAAYVHLSHVLLAVAALVGPVIVASLDPSMTAGRVIGIGALAILVAAGGGILVANGFVPWHPVVRIVAESRRQVLLGAVVVVAAAGIMLLLPAAGGGVSIAAIPMAWALRAISGGSFWAGIARMFTVAVICGAVIAAVALVTAQSVEPLTLVVALLFAFGVLGQDSIYTLAIELDDLRTLEADRAVATERKRLAGDLHDIQGQHLGLITVEAELVTRLIAADDPAGAATHARRLQSIAADALEELHRVVHDTRAVSLDLEIANAARVLESAGISVTQHVDDIAALHEPTDRLLGLTVREAITNILKHSRARDCAIHVVRESRAGVRGVTLVVADSGPASTHMVKADGNGLTMLRERYREAGGELTFINSAGAKLTAWTPAPEEGPQ